MKTSRSKALVDATGDANAVGLAGFELIRSDVVQPATLTFGCSGYDPDALDYTALKTAADVAVAAGELVITDISWRGDGPEALLRRHGHNANHEHAPDAHTSEGRSRAEFEGRKALLRMYRFLRRQPGLDKFRIDWVCPEIGIRETVTIRGKKTIAESDYEFDVLYDDAVCYAFYPIDEHLNDGKGINKRLLRQGAFPTIPRVGGADTRRLNILLITAVQFRWDALGRMGNPVIQTPHLDALAGRGMLFRNAFTPTPIRVSVQASIMGEAGGSRRLFYPA